ncbi:hypothetical protein KAR91_18950 [Candidatus Pacearchaeota archaeon]|nr:hypothetical protein [Candidatus Pacearchaeota archaeon]
MSQNLTAGPYSAYNFKCVITDGLSYIEVESPNWSHQAKWVGARFTIEFPGKIVSKITVIKTEPGPNNTPTFYVDDLGNHDQLKRAVLKASHKGWPVYVEHTFICLEPS